MNRITHNTQTFILSRIFSARSLVELVDISTCETVFVGMDQLKKGDLANVRPAPTNPQRDQQNDFASTFSILKPTYPGNIEFSERDPTFIDNLQSERIRLLAEARRLKQITKGRTNKVTGSSPRVSKPRASKKVNVMDELARMMAEKLKQAGT